MRFALKPCVSVVMNCRNGAKFIGQALVSLVNQTFPDWELVAWDDGSTDETLRVLHGYDDKRFRIFASEKGTSLASVRRAAISRCRGQWIAFLDQDDLWLPRKLEMQLDKANEDPAAVLIYGRALQFSAGKACKDYDHRHAWSALPEGSIFLSLFEDSCFICMSTVLIRANRLTSVPTFPRRIRLTIDYFLYLTLSQNDSVRAVQQPVSLYRWHGGNVSNQRGIDVHSECVYLMRRFSGAVDPALIRRRLAVHQTLIAFALLSSWRTLGKGILRLCKYGSVTYLAGRPFAVGWRFLRYVAITPQWKRKMSAAQINTFLAESSGGPRNKTLGSTLGSSAPTTSPSIGRFPLLGSPVSVSTFQEAVSFLSKLVGKENGGYFSNANVYSIMLARDDKAFMKAIANASYLSADGMPIVWMLRALGRKAERVHGDDLLFACCERFPHWQHFFVGGRTGQAEAISRELKRRYPDLCIVGSRSTPIRPLVTEDTNSILSEVVRSGATMVWVGMGTPDQDLWMASVAGRVNVAMAGVGSAFDALSGHSRFAPPWMKRIGLQWLFRLLQEPRRLFRRYLISNSRFLLAALAFSGAAFRKHLQQSQLGLPRDRTIDQG